MARQIANPAAVLGLGKSSIPPPISASPFRSSDVQITTGGSLAAKAFDPIRGMSFAPGKGGRKKKDANVKLKL